MTEPKTLDEIATTLSNDFDRFGWLHLDGPGIIHAALQQAYDLGRDERDKEWREAADGHFEDIRPSAGLIEMYAGGEKDLPTAIIHEIWKRDPRTQDAVADERKALREWVQKRRTNDTASGSICADDLIAALDTREKESR